MRQPASAQHRLIMGLVLLALSGFLLFLAYHYVQTVKTISALENDKLTISAAITKLEKESQEAKAEAEDVKVAVIKETTGLDPLQIGVDQTVAQRYFEQAFNWSDAASYNNVRDRYVADLGEDNSFTSTYLPKDTVIDTSEGPLSFIDYKGIQASMDTFTVIPLLQEGDRIRYVGLVYYIMHKDASDLANTDALARSEAILEFTVSGEGEDRKVSEVSARSGFSSGLRD